MLRKSPTGTWLPAWVPESSVTLAALLLICSTVQSATVGYDGSMLNGLNILDSYTDYFHLTPAILGLQTGSVFIGGCLGPLFSGVLCDRLGRRPTIFWGAIVSLVGIVLQTAAQNTAMFTVGRIILGFGSAIDGIASGVYLSETFSARYRAWGVGLLNDFYYVGALIAAGITLGTGQWQSTWAWRAPSAFQAIFAIICIIILPFVYVFSVVQLPFGLTRQSRITSMARKRGETGRRSTCSRPSERQQRPESPRRSRSVQGDRGHITLRARAPCIDPNTDHQVADRSKAGADRNVSRPILLHCW